MAEFVELVQQIQAAGQNPALVSFDIDRIREYVFATSRPKEIAGASKLVEKATGDWLDGWLGSVGLGRDSVCYACGGSGLILVPGDKAADLCQRIEQEYASKTITGSCTAVFGELPAGAVANGAEQDGWFGPAWKSLSVLLRRRKDEKGLAAKGTQALPGYLRRCESCGRDVACQRHADWVCLSCDTKRQAYQGSFDERAELCALVADGEGNEEKLAVIYADARGMGSMLEQAKTWAAAKELSAAMWSATAAALSGVKSVAGPGQTLAPVAGGDDIVVFLPASKALTAVKQLREAFHSSLAGSAAAGLQLDIGLLVADCKLGAAWLFEYARALLRSAKSFGYELADHLQVRADTIDWLVLKGGSPLSLAIDRLRRTEYVRKFDRLEYGLTEKPYFWPQAETSVPSSIGHRNFAQLLDHRDEFMPVAASQRRTIAAHLLDHPDVATLNAVYQVLRAEGLDENLRNQRQWDKFFIHRPHANTASTGWFDLLELIEELG